MKRPLFAVCCTYPAVLTDAVINLVSIAHASSGQGEWFWSRDSLGVDLLRNAAVRYALDGDFSHLVFFDVDMTFPPDVIERLLSHEQAITSGLYFMRQPPNPPVHFPRMYRRGEVQDVELVGMGCTILPVQLFRDLVAPWFQIRSEKGLLVETEEVSLCRRARAAGYRVCVDASIVCGHIVPVPIGEEERLYL